MIHPDMLDESPKDILKRAAEKKIWEEIEDKDNREVLLARSWKTSVGTSTTSSSPRSPLWISEPYSRDMDKVVPNDVLEQPMPRGAQKGDQNAGSGIIIPMQSSLPFIPKPKKEMTEADRSNDDSEVLDELPDRKVSEIADYKITEQTIQVPANSKAHTSIKMNKNSDVKLSKNYTGVVKAPSRRVSFISTKEVYTQAPSTPSMPPPPVTGDHIPSLVFPNNALSPTPINLVTRNLSIFIGEGVSLDPIDPAPESNAGWAMGLSIAVIFVAVFTPFLTLILENIGEGQTECLLCKMWSSFLVGLTTYIILRLFNG
jgi:hypothetical protein